ncbi:NAD(P)-dependent glycerol-1-phosphate dehydrogenase [Candidatus Bathyarchaeota archaeon]|nr:NAD(P)-dependent glycerol-1-phosphate dehydrogenase [Candidatus Bathyarchaeota archaeon]
MSNTHRIDLPKVVIIGENVIESLGDICHEFGFKKVMIVTGYKTFEVAGKRASKILSTSGLSVDHTFADNSNMECVEEVKERMVESGAEVAIAIGGGRVIDITKLSSTRGKKPFISIPTNASHDGFASKGASIKELNRPFSIEAQSPIAVIADSQIIARSPYQFTASGCGDIMAKSVSVRDWRLGQKVKNEYYGEYAASLALMSVDLVMKFAENIRRREQSGIRTLLEALVSCGVAMSIAGSSRPCSGSEHLFSHVLDIIAPNQALHGEQCGVGTIMMANLYDMDWMLIRDKLRLIGAPTNAIELGIESKYIIEALFKAKEIRPERYTILDEINLTRSKAKTLAETCGVI